MLGANRVAGVVAGATATLGATEREDSTPRALLGASPPSTLDRETGFAASATAPTSPRATAASPAAITRMRRWVEAETATVAATDMEAIVMEGETATGEETDTEGVIDTEGAIDMEGVIDTEVVVAGMTATEVAVEEMTVSALMRSI